MLFCSERLPWQLTQQRQWWSNVATSSFNDISLLTYRLLKPREAHPKQQALTCVGVHNRERDITTHWKSTQHLHPVGEADFTSDFSYGQHRYLSLNSLKLHMVSRSCSKSRESEPPWGILRWPSWGECGHVSPRRSILSLCVDDGQFPSRASPLLIHVWRKRRKPKGTLAHEHQHSGRKISEWTKMICPHNIGERLCLFCFEYNVITCDVSQ